MEQIFILKEELKNIKSPSDIFNKILKFKIDYNQENLIIFYLNAKNKIINSEVLFKGGLTSCISEPNTIFRKALLKNSYSIIIAHNHPSNNLTPSNEDLNIFKLLKEGGELLNIKVLDSLIFNKKEFYSLVEGSK